MTAVFGTVTADLAEDLVNKFPAELDFLKMIDKVSKSTGVILLISERQYKLQGLWLSIGKAFSLLTFYSDGGENPHKNHDYYDNHNNTDNYSDVKPESIGNFMSDHDISQSSDENTEIESSPIIAGKISEPDELITEDSKVACDINNKYTLKVPNVDTNILVVKQSPEINNTDKSLSNNCMKATRSNPKRNCGKTRKTENAPNGNLLVKQKLFKFTKMSGKSKFVSRPLMRNRKRELQNKLKVSKQFSESIDSRDSLDNLNFADSNEDIYEDDMSADDQEIRQKQLHGRCQPTNGNSLYCSECDFIAQTIASLNNHKNKYHKLKSLPTKCDLCLKVFPNRRYMLRHRISHVEPQHCCDICGKMYKIKKSMEIHRKTHDKSYTKPVVNCSQCSKQFCNSYVLRCHIKSEHLGEKKSFLCSQCGKSFTTKHSLQEHSNAHTGLKPHVCEICGKGFNYESALRDHKYTHTEIRQFSCTICNKQFCQRSSLKMHLRIHSVDKKFACEDCGRAFTQKQALQRHERVHKGLKPFICKFCQRMFTDSSIIRRHLILVHKVHKDSNSWREDIICKINSTNFRVEKIDSNNAGLAIVKEKENNVLEGKGEVIEALPHYTSGSYSVTNEVFVIDPATYHSRFDANHITHNNMPETPLATGTKSPICQALDYSDRHSNSINLSSNHMHDKDIVSSLNVDQTSGTPVSISNVWNIASVIEEESKVHIDPSNPSIGVPVHNLSQHYTDPGTSNQSLSKTYQSTINLENSNIISHDVIPTTTTADQGSGNNAGTFVYQTHVSADVSTNSDADHFTYYSQLASQFGMNLNDYTVNGYINALTTSQHRPESHPQVEQHQQVEQHHHQ